MADGQVAALDGRLQMFSAQSPAFINGINTPSAVTAMLAGVSNPHGLSINNGFGRVWPANVPAGMTSPTQMVGFTEFSNPTNNVHVYVENAIANAGTPHLHLS